MSLIKIFNKKKINLSILKKILLDKGFTVKKKKDFFHFHDLKSLYFTGIFSIFIILFSIFLPLSLNFKEDTIYNSNSDKCGLLNKNDSINVMYEDDNLDKVIDSIKSNISENQVTKKELQELINNNSLDNDDSLDNDNNNLDNDNNNLDNDDSLDNDVSSDNDDNLDNSNSININ